MKTTANDTTYNFKTKLVFLDSHGIVFRELLEIWIKVHPRTHIWTPDNYSISMSVAAWKRFCNDYNFDFNTL